MNMRTLKKWKIGQLQIKDDHTLVGNQSTLNTYQFENKNMRNFERSGIVIFLL